MAYVIYPDKCNGCGVCLGECPLEAIRIEQSVYVIDPEVCTECGTCADLCPAEAVSGK